MSKKEAVVTSTGVTVRKKPLSLRIWNHRGYYIMFIPVLIFLLIMHYWPMLGVRYAFYDYYVVLPKPIYVGFKHFETMFGLPQFWSAFSNTLVLSIMKLILTTVSSVVVSIFLNEMNNLFAKKTLQTIIYLPHFMSWAVVASIFTLFLSASNTGMLNGLLRDWGFIQAGQEISFLEREDLWRPVFYLVNIWKETGWGTIIFLATLSGINPELYEAADIDGATRFQKMRYVTLPALGNTIMTVVILNLAKVMNMFESVFVMYNPSVYDEADVLATYIYRQTFNNAVSNYGYSTAVGLFRSLVGAFLVIVCNWASKKTRGRGII